MTAQQKKRMGARQGFTLMELMVTMAVMAILVSVGMPNIISWVEDARIKSAASDLQSDLFIARSSAAKLNCDVSIAPAAGGWASGWTVSYKASASTDLSCASSGGVSVTLATREARPGVTISQPALTSGTEVIYGFDGRVANVGAGVASFAVSTMIPSVGAHPKCVKFNSAGRPEVSAAKADGSC